jgi:hypothetical protein
MLNSQGDKSAGIVDGRNGVMQGIGEYVSDDWEVSGAGQVSQFVAVGWMDKVILARGSDVNDSVGSELTQEM